MTPGGKRVSIRFMYLDYTARVNSWEPIMFLFRGHIQVPGYVQRVMLFISSR